MGEATYYIKAYYENEELAATACERFTRLIKELEGSYQYWQTNRNKPATKFWPEFIALFPLSTELLNIANENIVNGNDCNNALAGVLSYTGEEENEPFEDGCVVCYSATVWHFADWEPLATWLEKNGAEKVNWVSDENMNPFDAI